MFNEDNIEVINSKAETKYLHQNFDYISETHDNFFIKLKTISMLTFPKNQIENSNELRDYFQKLCAQIKIEYIDDKNWTWK
ncbi:YcxB family protein [Epilithonimonas arachidiradicis]|uniref:YcxB family protein n=1 Tax=Epilithonimonas arachidiradicis TaxID=1617282 RepID=UPI003CC820D2